MADNGGVTSPLARRVQQARLLRTLGIVLALVLLAAVIRGCTVSNHEGTPAAPPADASSSPVASSTPPSPGRTPGRASPTARPSASPKVTPTASLPPGVTRDPDGFVRTNLASTNKFRTSTVEVATTPDARRWILMVESSVNVDVNATALEVQKILDDPRSWRGVRQGSGAGQRFRLVKDATQAQLVVRLASPKSVDRRCPLTTRSLWSCATGPEVLINADRWAWATPTYARIPLSEYRAYLINHEVGHTLGLGHVGCAGRGKLAPVMMQQSKGTQGCKPNAWPAP